MEEKPQRTSAYPKFHRNRVNLLIHLIAVPLFVASVFGILWCAIHEQFLQAAALSLGPVVSVACQRYGHRLEASSAPPFSSPSNFLKRILVEQFSTFPRFVISGGWFTAMQAEDADAASPIRDRD